MSQSREERLVIISAGVRYTNSTNLGESKRLVGITPELSSTLSAGGSIVYNMDRRTFSLTRSLGANAGGSFSANVKNLISELELIGGGTSIGLGRRWKLSITEEFDFYRPRSWNALLKSQLDEPVDFIKYSLTGVIAGITENYRIYSFDSPPNDLNNNVSVFQGLAFPIQNLALKPLERFLGEKIGLPLQISIVKKTEQPLTEIERSLISAYDKSRELFSSAFDRIHDGLSGMFDSPKPPPLWQMINSEELLEELDEGTLSSLNDEVDKELAKEDSNY